MSKNRKHGHGNVRSGRQPYPQVATNVEIQNQRAAAGGMNFSKRVENNMNTSNNENGSTNPMASVTEVSNEPVAEVLVENVGSGDIAEQADTGIVNVDATITEANVSQEVEDAIFEEVAETLFEEVAEEELNVFDSLVEPLNFSTLSNTLILTAVIDASYGHSLDEETIETLTAIGDNNFDPLVDGDEQFANVYNPFKTENGWMKKTVPLLTELFNEFATHSTPILAGSTNMVLATGLVANGIENRVSQIPSIATFGVAYVDTGTIVPFEENAESDESDDDSLEDESDMVINSLEEFYCVDCYSAQIPEEDDFSIITNLSFVNPFFYSRDAKYPYLAKLAKFLTKQFKDSLIPVYFNVSFSTLDIITDTELRSVMDALIADGYILDTLLTTQEEHTEALFGANDIILSLCLTPQFVNDGLDDDSAED